MARVIKRGSFRDKVAVNASQQRAKSSSFGHLMLPSGLQVFKEEPGTRILLDFLPYVVTDENHPDRKDEYDIAVKDSLWYRRPYRYHRNIGVEQTGVVCPTSIGKKCPICEARNMMLAKGAQYKDDEVKALKVTEKVLYYVIPQEEKKWEDKPHLWDISSYIFQSKLNEELEQDPDHYEFPDIDHGITLRIRFSEEKFMTNTFADTARIDFLARDYSYTEEDVLALKSLDEILIIKSYDEIAVLYHGTSVEGDKPTSEQDDAPAASKRSSRLDDDPPRRERSRQDKPTADDPPMNTSRSRRDAPEDEQHSRRAERGRSEPQEEPTRGPTRRSPPPEDDAPADKASRGGPRPGRESNACPHNYTFGDDCDKHPECNDCVVWGKCLEAMEAKLTK